MHLQKMINAYHKNHSKKTIAILPPVDSISSMAKLLI